MRDGSPFGPAPAPPAWPAQPSGWSPHPAYAAPGTPAHVPPYRLGPLGADNGRTGPFLEAFAIYLAGQIVLPLAARPVLRAVGEVPEGYRLAANLLVLLPAAVAVAWPWLRGVRGYAFRRGFGWVAPGGAARDVGGGVAAYLAGLPVFAVGMGVSLLLLKLTGTTASHPIADDPGDGGPGHTVLLFALAAVWAPVVEETFFRGALLHHLRTRWGWVVSALASSVIFAAVHPQGWALVPALASLAVVFCAMREWRGGTLPGMVAHALHNGALVTMLVMAT